MTIEFLHALAARTVPFNVTSPHEVELLMSLRSEGLLSAFFLNRRNSKKALRVARFLALTPAGRAAVADDAGHAAARAFE